MGTVLTRLLLWLYLTWKCFPYLHMSSKTYPSILSATVSEAAATQDTLLALFLIDNSCAKMKQGTWGLLNQEMRIWGIFNNLLYLIPIKLLHFQTNEYVQQQQSVSKNYDVLRLLPSTCNKHNTLSLILELI